MFSFVARIRCYVIKNSNETQLLAFNRTYKYIQPCLICHHLSLYLMFRQRTKRGEKQQQKTVS